MTKIRLLHTSDWHLGKKLSRFERIDEQRLFLDWLIELIKARDINYLLIAGDIFDQLRPDLQGLELYYDFLEKLSQTSCQLYLIAGNHDSGRFLEGPGKILKKMAFHVVGRPSENGLDHHFELLSPDRSFSLHLACLPYFRLQDLHTKGHLKNSTKLGINSNLQKLLEDFLEQHLSIPKLSHRVKAHLLMAHHLGEGYHYAGSEEKISTELLLQKKWLQHYDYVALGHIHQYQILNESSPLIAYSGAPLSYRFGENPAKKVQLLEFNAQGKFVHFPIQIPQFRSMSVLTLTHDTWEQEIESFTQKLLQGQTGLRPWLKVQIDPQGLPTAVLDQIKTQLHKLEESLGLDIIQWSMLSLPEKKTAHELPPIPTSANIREHHELPQLFKQFVAKHEPVTERADNLLKTFQDLWEENHHQQSGEI